VLLCTFCTFSPPKPPKYKIVFFRRPRRRGGAIFGFSTTAPFSLTASAMTGTSAVGGNGGCYFDESTKRGKRRPWRRSWRRVFYVVIRQPARNMFLSSFLKHRLYFKKRQSRRRHFLQCNLNWSASTSNDLGSGSAF
jgi:hypothetical protein